MKKDATAAMSFHMVLRSRVKKQLKSIASLPEEILFNILLLLPADVLYDVMRFVCRQCYIIINDPTFVNTHSLRASSITLVQDSRFHARFLLIRERDIKISDIKFQFNGCILSCCNGLTLVWDATICTTYITNPITNRVMTLPPCPFPTVMYSLVFAASSNTYKVVVVTRENIHVLNHPSYYGLAILTVGVDRAWRSINYSDMRRHKVSVVKSAIGQGFLYWRSLVSYCVIAFNIESERFTTISLPEVHVGKGRRFFLSNRNTLSYIHHFRDFSISVWMLKDHETGDWVKISDFNVEVIVREAAAATAAKFVFVKRLESFNDWFIPSCWLDEEKIFGFVGGFSIYFSYDIKTRATHILEMEVNIRIFNHLNSLTWL